MLDEFENKVEKNKLFKKGDKVIVGVSGGPDSVCLLNLLDRIKDEYNLELIVAHVNYGTRGRDSDKDEEFVKNFARKLNLDLKVLHITSDKLEVKGNLEENLRNIRYKFFENLRTEIKADRIAVAHNKNDMVETMLMFFLRGSGLRGLTSMHEKQGRIIRPLLDFTKAEIKQYLDKLGIEYRKDQSNLDLKYTRNRIRHELIPYLVEKYNPNLIETLSVTRNAMGDDYEFIRSFSKYIYKDLSKKEKGFINIELKDFLDLFPTLQREIIRIIFHEFEVAMKDVSFLDLSELLRVMKEGKGGSKRTIKGLRFEKKSGSMLVSKDKQ